MRYRWLGRRAAVTEAVAMAVCWAATWARLADAAAGCSCPVTRARRERRAEAAARRWERRLGWVGGDLQ